MLRALAGDSKTRDELVRRLSLWIGGFELALVAGFLAMNGLQSSFADPWVLLVGSVVRVALLFVDLGRALAPLLAHLDAPSEGPESLRAAERALAQVSRRFGIHYATGWLVMLALAMGLGWLGIPRATPIGTIEIVFGASIALLAAIQVPQLMRPMFGHVLFDAQLEVNTALRERGDEPINTHESMARTTVAFPLAIVAGLTFMFGGTVIHERALILRAKGVSEQVARAELSALALRHGELRADELEPGVRVIASAAELPPLLATAEPEPESGLVSAHERRTELAMAAMPLDDERWVVAEAEVEQELGLLLLLALVLVPSSIAPTALASYALGRSLEASLEQIEDATRELADKGDFRGFARIIPLRRDELGRVAVNLNRMVDVFDELASAATQVAEGDLMVELGGEGDLPNAFRAMLERLHELASQIRATALELSSAATDIRAATGEQEQTVNLQSSRMLAVTETMLNLALGSAEINESATEVLSNAEQTQATTDEVAESLMDLSRAADRISELLEMIREIANRSDILALNGALEAGRAGEAGQGFALVAEEMRLLAERVTGTVGEVRARIADIEAAANATASATASSRQIADKTAAAARQITSVSARQSERTNQASTQVVEVDAGMTTTANAVRQALVAAESLRDLSIELERLTGRFKLSPPA